MYSIHYRSEPLRGNLLLIRWWMEYGNYAVKGVRTRYGEPFDSQTANALRATALQSGSLSVCKERIGSLRCFYQLL